jgi:predicted transcriptional regulator
MIQKVNTRLNPPGLRGRAALVWRLVHTPEYRGIPKEIATERNVSPSAVSQGLRRGSPTYVALAAAKIVERRRKQEAVDATLRELLPDSS